MNITIDKEFKSLIPPLTADAIVKSYYYCGEWTKAKNEKTVKWCIDWFLSAKTKQEG